MEANRFIKSAAVLLTAWYLFAVTGFDIHRCSCSGMTYIEPLFAGISCNEIHPDFHCCHHNETEEHSCHGKCEHCSGYQDKDGCCTDEIEVIILSGFETGQDCVPHFSAPSVILSSGIEGPVLLSRFSSPGASRYLPGGPPGQILHLDCIMRA